MDVDADTEADVDASCFFITISNEPVLRRRPRFSGCCCCVVASVSVSVCSALLLPLPLLCIGI